MSFIQYLKDTRSELHHVAWPTRSQTVIYTIIVILLSIFVALYLGFFDFVFTTGLSRTLQVLPESPASGIAIDFDSASTSDPQLLISTSSRSTGSGQAPQQ